MCRGSNGESFVVVKLRHERPLIIGDKVSSREGNKAIAAQVLPQSDMPYTESGLTPDFIFNPHSFPTRMTIGQLIEVINGKKCAKKGYLADGTFFLPHDIRSVMEAMPKLGLRFNGKERMYNGKTGQYYDVAIFIGPTTIQRLQKFVLDDEQVVGSSTPIDALTGQPLGGKAQHGGLRLGEMELWNYASHGSMINMSEKILKDSDGREVYICTGCGMEAIYNSYSNIYECKICKEMADISAVSTTKSALLFKNQISSANVNVLWGLKPHTY